MVFAAILRALALGAAAQRRAQPRRPTVGRVRRERPEPVTLATTGSAAPTAVPASRACCAAQARPLPADKSVAHRALLFAAMSRRADRPSW